MKSSKPLAALLLAAAMLATGCSCQQRMERLRRSCPECFRPDTLRLVDTVAPDPVHINQWLPWSAFDTTPTLLIEQPQYTLLVTVGDDGIDLAAEVRHDTMILVRKVPVNLPVPVPVPVPAPRRGAPWAWPAALAVGLIALWGIVREVRRLRK